MRTFRSALGAVLILSTCGYGQPSAVFHSTLDDLASITTTNGYISDGPAAFLPGAISNALAGNNSAYARWDDADVGAIFDSGWDDDLGITADLYFRGDHWNTHSGDSGLWGIAKRSPDRFFLIAVRDGKPRVVLRDEVGEFEYPLTGVGLANDVTYRLTVRQADGQFDVYLEGGAYSNDSPVFSAGDLPAGHTWNMVPAGGSPARQMNIGRRPVFGGVLQTGEWVDEVRVFNGFFSPEDLDQTACEPPVVITDPPDDAAICPGQAVAFELAATGSNLTFQWQKDGQDLSDGGSVSGVSTAQMQIVNSQVGDSGNYRCVVNGDCGTSVSSEAVLAVSPAPIVADQPLPQEVCPQSTVIFTVTVTGAGAIDYQWQKNGQDLTDGGDLSGSSTDTLQISDVEASDEGDYRCIVGDTCGAAASEAATLTVREDCVTNIGISPGGHFVTYRGETLMLVGDSGTQVVTQNGNIDHREWIDDCAERGIRAVHLWSFVAPRQTQDGSVIEDRYGYVYPGLTPWARKTTGPPATDQLNQWDLRAFDDGADGDFRRYWPRMRDLCSYAESKRLLVGITVFFGWPKHDSSSRPDWSYHPFNVVNGGHLTNNDDVQSIASPGTEVWNQAWSEGWSNALKTQWVWERLCKKLIDDLNGFGNVFFVFMDEHSYSEGNCGDHFLSFFKTRGAVWVDWSARRPTVDWVMSGTFSGSDRNSNAVSGFYATPVRPYLNLEGSPYMGDEVRSAIWTFSIGGGHYFFHADERQETVTTGIMGYDPYVPGGDKGMYKRDWLGHASRFFNEHVQDLGALAPQNGLSSAGTYCLADPGREYVVYSKTGSSIMFSLDMSAGAGMFSCRLYNPREGEFEPTFSRTGGGVRSFTKPDLSDWALHVLRQAHRPGDFDGDLDVDQEDFGRLQMCLTESGESQTEPSCLDALLDEDQDVDQEDIEIFFGCISGANVPSDPACADQDGAVE